MRSLALVLAALSAAGPTRAAGATPPPAAPPAEARSVLGLDEAVRTALVRQPQLRQAAANREAAGARSDSARAPLLPQLRADAGYERGTSNAAPRTGILAGLPVTMGGESWDTSPSVSASATLSQVLFDPAQLQRWRSARAAADALRASERAIELQVVAAVRAAFFAARAGRDLVVVARETLTNQEAHLRQVQAFVEVGTRPEIDLAQARADRANAEVQLIQAENGYAVSRAQLAQAMGVERETDFDVGDDVLPPVDGEEEPLEALVAQAMAARPEVASFRDQDRSQHLARSAARAGYLPTVSARTGVTDDGPSFPDAAWNWSAGVTLGWSIFQGGATRAQVREAEANLENVRAQEDQFRQQVRLEVDQARLAVRASRASLVAAAEAEAAARDRLRLAEGRYEAGAGSIIELGDAQVAATAAAAQRVRAQYDVSAARAELLRALGRPASEPAAR